MSMMYLGLVIPIVFYLVIAAIIVIALWFVIRSAVRRALWDHHERVIRETGRGEAPPLGGAPDA